MAALSPKPRGLKAERTTPTVWGLLRYHPATCMATLQAFTQAGREGRKKVLTRPRAAVPHEPHLPTYHAWCVFLPTGHQTIRSITILPAVYYPCLPGEPYPFTVLEGGMAWAGTFAGSEQDSGPNFVCVALLPPPLPFLEMPA